MNALKKLGAIITIDDFGTEYSSLNYIKQLPVDRIKIARQFIQGIGKNKKDEAIINTIIALAKNLEMRIIAEGVETENQLSFLTKKACDEIQGFYFFKPLQATEIEKILNDTSAINK